MYYIKFIILTSALNVEYFFEEKSIDEERKEHPREWERDHKKRQYKKDMERRAKEMINDWKRREDDRKRMRKKEKEKEEDNLR